MKLLRASLLLPLWLGVVHADDGIVASATRTVSLTPTDAVIQVTINADTQKTLDDVLAKAKDIGLTASNLYSITSIPGVSTGVPGVPGIPGYNIYAFRTTAPLSGATAALQQIQQFAAANTGVFQTNGSVVGVSVNAATLQDTQRQVFPDLYSQAKARAEQMASDAGLTSGRVLAVSDSSQSISVLGLYTTLQVPFSVGVRLEIK